MKFYRLDEAAVSREDVVFKESPMFNAIWAIFLFGVAIAMVVVNIAWLGPLGRSTWFLYLFAAIFALVALIPLFNFRSSLKPSNWLLRCQLGGILVKYRAYENWKLPADSLQVVAFDHGEIAWAKLVKERRISPSGDSHHGNQVEFLTYIDLGLVSPDTAELEANLQAERSLRPNNMIVTMDYPVQVLPGGVVEIRWGAGFRPSAKKALETLAPRVKIVDMERRTTDLTHHYGANAESEKANILALVQSGRDIEAVKLARQVFGGSLAQARDYVNGLRSDNRPE